MMQHLSIPHVEEIGSTFYVTWDEGVKIKMSTLKTDSKGQIDAEVLVWDYHELNPKLISPRRIGLLRGFRNIVKDLEDNGIHVYGGSMNNRVYSYLYMGKETKSAVCDNVYRSPHKILLLNDVSLHPRLT